MRTQGFDGQTRRGREPRTEIACAECGEVVAVLQAGEAVVASGRVERTIRGTCECGKGYTIPTRRQP